MAHKPGETPHGALAEGVKRFERIARIVKDNQLARTKTGPQPPVSEAFVLNPNEAWAKKYMTHCIGPVCFGPATMAVPFAKKPAMPQVPAESRDLAAAATRPQSGPIGLAIGKPVKARSWLGRLFLRR